MLRRRALRLLRVGSGRYWSLSSGYWELRLLRVGHRGQQARPRLGHGGQHRAAQHRLAGYSGRHHARAGGPDAGDRGGDPVRHGGAAGPAHLAAQYYQARVEHDADGCDPDRDPVGEFG